jgi:predicted transposase YbfD/YdcC
MRAIEPTELGLLGASQVARLDRHRTVKGQTKDSELWLATSRPTDALPPSAFLKARRDEWGIENGLHYVLDVSGDEDRRLHVRTLNNLCGLTLLSRISVALWRHSQRGKKWPCSYYRWREHHKARPGHLLRLLRAPLPHPP